MDKVVKLQLTNFLNVNIVITSRRFGFRGRISTDNFIHVFFLIYIYETFSNNKIEIAVLLDLSKAFDTVDHRRLLNKFKLYGVHGATYLMFRSYFINHFQYVSMSGVCLRRLKISCGVPHGSNTGPVLFLFYSNDILEPSNILKFTIYAKGTPLLFDTHNFHQSIVI